jgi:ribosomal subunit interface protein
MKYSLQTENIVLTDLEANSLQEKLDRLEKLMRPPFVIDVILRHDRHHRKGDVVTCRVNIEQGKYVFHAERKGGTVADCVDEVVQALQKELQKRHDKVLDERRTIKRFPEEEEI